jgi:hypothetical protein
MGILEFAFIHAMNVVILPLMMAMNGRNLYALWDSHREMKRTLKELDV